MYMIETSPRPWPTFRKLVNVNIAKRLGTTPCSWLWYGSHHRHIVHSRLDSVYYCLPQTQLMLLIVLLLQLPVLGPPVLAIFSISNHCTGSRYKNALNTKLFAPRISSSSLLLHVTCTISSQSRNLDPLDRLHWLLFSNHQLTPVTSLQTAPSGLPPHLRNKLPPTLRVSQFDPSSSPSSSPSSYSHSGSLVDLSYGVFHSRLKTFIFSKSFPT